MLSSLFASAYDVPSACPAGNSPLFRLSSGTPFCGCSAPPELPLMLPGASCQGGCFLVCVSLPTGPGERLGTDGIFLFLGPRRSSVCLAHGRTWVVWPEFSYKLDIGPSQKPPDWEKGAREGRTHFGSNAPDCPPPLWTFPREAHCGGLTFVERGLSGLVGDVRLGPSLEEELEAVQVSPASCQVKGRFLLQGALVDDCRVC